MKEEDVIITKRCLYQLIKKFKKKGVYNDLQQRAWDKKLTPEMLIMINNELEENNEATASGYLRVISIEKYPELEATILTVKRQC